jgi:hypothetical protein
MTRTIDWASWALNLITGACIFLGGTAIYAPDAFGIVSPRQEIAEAVKLEADGSLPAMTEEQLARIDWTTQ